MFDELVAALADGSLKSLPVQSLPLSQSQAAMRVMAQARHIGKIVLLPDAIAGAGAVSDDASYWITGGLGALGLATARWLVRAGARHLVLTGRSAPRPAARQAIAELQALGAEVRVEAVDVADASAMRALFADIASTMPPLRGVVHAAGTLARRRAVPAAMGRGAGRAARQGARRLGAARRHAPPAARLLRAVFGGRACCSVPRGRALYAAANAELDALAQARRLAGLPALSVAWGAWAGAGMAAEAAANGRDVWAERGLLTITPELGFAALQTLLDDGVASAAVLPIDWPRFAASLPPGGDASFFAAVAAAGPGSRAGGVARGRPAGSAGGAASRRPARPVGGTGACTFSASCREPLSMPAHRSRRSDSIR